MKQKLHLLIILLVSCFAGYAQSPWNNVTPEKLQGLEKMDRMAMPSKYALYSLNLQAVKQNLQNAPLRGAGVTSTVEMEFPIGKDKFETFKIYNAPVVAEGLAARYSGLNSYVGQSVTNPATSVRFSVTLFGLHAMIFSTDGTVYIDTYTKNLNNYIVYNRSDLHEDRTFECEVEENIGDAAGRLLTTNTVQSPQMDDSTFRTYRLAMACTIEYASYHINAAGLGSSATLEERKAAVLAAMVVTVTRVDGIYERDMAVTMELVANNDDIIFIFSDNFSNNNAGMLIGQSQTVINNTIGSPLYDIGHTVSTGGGGLAGLGVVCTSSQKARGITGSPAPVGDAYDVDYVAHEMGHQFGANHTFNGSGGSCTGNRNNATAVEPGSGSTIMAYAGICTSNVQTNSDDYFHAVSIAEMKAYVLSGATCAATQDNGNSAPVVDAGADYVIPTATPFVLEATAVDEDGDALTYCWEQMDNEISTQPPVATATGGPNFRSKDPVSSPKRYLPALESVLDNDLTPTWEVTSFVGRTFDFACTVRDNQTVAGGQTGRDDMSVVVNSSYGPFDVTSQSGNNITWTIGDTETITWTVNGTNNIAGATNVDILLSTDGGYTYNTILVSDTPNDGTEDIVVPDVSSASCRVMVKPTGNIFYDVNEQNIVIGAETVNTCLTFSNDNVLVVPDGVGTDTAGSIVSNSIVVPNDGVIYDVNVTVDVTHTYISDLLVTLVSPSGDEVVLWGRSCGGQDAFNVTFDDDGGNIFFCSNPFTGVRKPFGNLSDFNGSMAAGTWTLNVADYNSGNTGQVNYWDLEICASYTASNEEFASISEFNVYPNPNSGNFTVQLNSASNKDVSLDLYDIRGRKVYTKTYINTGAISENVNLSNLASGLYLLNVSDGVSTETKKIVIK